MIVQVVFSTNYPSGMYCSVGPFIAAASLASALRISTVPPGNTCMMRPMSTVESLPTWECGWVKHVVSNETSGRDMKICLRYFEMRFHVRIASQQNGTCWHGQLCCVSKYLNKYIYIYIYIYIEINTRRFLVTLFVFSAKWPLEGGQLRKT